MVKRQALSVFVGLLAFTFVKSLELEKCGGDRMSELACKRRIKENGEFCKKGVDGQYDFARAYCCKTCIVSLGFTKEDGISADYEKTETVAWLKPQGPKEDGFLTPSKVSLTPWCEMMKHKLKVDFCTQTPYALKCRKTCDIDCDE